MGKNIFILLVWVLLSVQANANAADVDINNNTPEDLAKIFYDAVNRDDLDKIKNMYSYGYYNSIITKNGFLSVPDRTLFAEHERRRFFKSKRVDIDSTKNGFFKTNASGVYSVLAKVIFTDQYALEFTKNTSIKSPHINDELCFKLVNGEWKITDKIKGY